MESFIKDFSFTYYDKKKKS